MSYYVRLMSKEDIAQVAVINREAFPTEWPPPNFQHELQNRLAHYVVAYDEGNFDKPDAKASAEKGTGLVSRLKQLFRRRSASSNDTPPESNPLVTGFVGFWIMADEAHITSIAVREAYRRRGIGELLMIAAIELATELKARIVTLEVRISNSGAQNLYTKYGFTQAGIRRGYYIDNREDAIVMSTDDINLAQFQAHLQKLKQAYFKRWGEPSINLSANYPLQTESGNSERLR